MTFGEPDSREPSSWDDYDGQTVRQERLHLLGPVDDDLLEAGTSPAGSSARSSKSFFGGRRRVVQAASLVSMLAATGAVLSHNGIPSLGRRGPSLDGLSASLVHLVQAPGGGSGSVGGASSSGGLSPMNEKTLDRLWGVERALVVLGDETEDQELCPAATPTVEALRQQEWPRPLANKAPDLTSVIYINLEWDTPRRTYMEAQLADLKVGLAEKTGKELRWERLPAVKAKEVEHDFAYHFWRQKGFSQAKSPDVRGDWATAACMISHMQAISQIPENEDQLVMIVEDDVDISVDFWELWEKLWPYVPEEWDVLRVGWFSDHQDCSQVVNEKIERAGWQDPHTGECMYCGAQAYIVNPLRKKQVLERFELAKMTHADELLGAPTPQLEDPTVVPELKSYVVWPMLARTKFDGDSPLFLSDRVKTPDSWRKRRLQK